MCETIGQERSEAANERPYIGNASAAVTEAMKEEGQIAALPQWETKTTKPTPGRFFHRLDLGERAMLDIENNYTMFSLFVEATSELQAVRLTIPALERALRILRAIEATKP